jgi:hypothetical protein
VVREHRPTPPAPAAEVVPSPPWPAAPEAPAPIGFRWQTVHHDMIFARLLVPSAWRIEKSPGALHSSVVRLAGDEEEVDIWFHAGTGAAERGLLAKPPRSKGGTINRVEDEGAAVAVDYVTGKPPRRSIEGFARGLHCKARLFRDRTLANESFAICASIRPADPGVWQRRRDVGPMMTAVPEHAVIEKDRENIMMFMGSLDAMISRERFDPKALLAYLRKPGTGELKVEVTIRERARGPVYLRRSAVLFQGNDPLEQFSVTSVHSGWECSASFTPFVRSPTPAEIDYAIALCDTLAPQ